MSLLQSSKNNANSFTSMYVYNLVENGEMIYLDFEDRIKYFDHNSV